MRSRALLVLIAVLALLASISVASASQDGGVDSPGATPGSCDGKEPKFHKHRAKAIIEDAYNTNRYPDKTPAKQSEKDAWREHKRCILIENMRLGIARFEDKQQKHYENVYGDLRFREKYTPYNCGSHGYYAIPCYIVACESGYSWSAYNPSGASGPYQLLGWGAPMPANTEAAKREHHKIAARLWAGGSGASHWVCA